MRDASAVAWRAVRAQPLEQRDRALRTPSSTASGVIHSVGIDRLGALATTRPRRCRRHPLLDARDDLRITRAQARSRSRGPPAPRRGRCAAVESRSASTRFARLRRPRPAVRRSRSATCSTCGRSLGAADSRGDGRDSRAAASSRRGSDRGRAASPCSLLLLLRPRRRRLVFRRHDLAQARESPASRNRCRDAAPRSCGSRPRRAANGRGRCPARCDTNTSRRGRSPGRSACMRNVFSNPRRSRVNRRNGTGLAALLRAFLGLGFLARAWPSWRQASPWLWVWLWPAAFFAGLACDGLGFAARLRLGAAGFGAAAFGAAGFGAGFAITTGTLTTGASGDAVHHGESHLVERRSCRSTAPRRRSGIRRTGA